MGRTRESTEIIAVRPLAWPHETLVEHCGIFGYWPRRPTPASLEWRCHFGARIISQVLMVICGRTRVASPLISIQRHKLLDKRSSLGPATTNGRFHLELLARKAFCQQRYSVKASGIDGDHGGIDLIVPEVDGRTWVGCKQLKRKHACNPRLLGDVLRSICL